MSNIIDIDTTGSIHLLHFETSSLSLNAGEELGVTFTLQNISAKNIRLNVCCEFCWTKEADPDTPKRHRIKIITRTCPPGFLLCSESLPLPAELTDPFYLSLSVNGRVLKTVYFDGSSWQDVISSRQPG